MFKKAERRQSKLRLGLIGPSGSGKTYSALLIAQGLGGKIALLDTERGSGSLYADLCDYDVAELTPPFTPERYIQAIKEAEAAGYDVLVIDSLTHAWAGEGGLLEYVDRASQALKNNFAAWREASPKHNALVDAMLGAPLHVIATIRSKTAWDVVKDERTGKTRPVKIGLAPVQRDGLEYEFTCVLELSVDGHIATASKDRTGLFDGQYFVPGMDTGQILREWLQGGRPENGHRENQPAETEADNEPEPAADTVPAAKRKNQDVFTRKKQEQKDKPDQPLSPTDSGLTVASLLNTLRELGLSDKLSLYEAYLLGKYGHDLRKLTRDQVNEQFVNLQRCKRDQELFQKFTAYLDSLRKKQAA